MSTGTERDVEGVEAYWRRRAIALTVVLGGVGLLAWACASGGGGGDKRPARNAAAVTTPSGPTPTGGIPGALPTITVTATTKVTVTPTVPKKKGDACEPGDLVVDLAAGKDTYAGKEWPQFRLSVVNTGERACTFGVGPKELELRITSGSDRVWSSMHCVQGSGSSIQMLRRGIPYLTTVSWDRKRSSDGCAGTRPPAQPGTYVATIKSPDIKTKRQVFRLR